MRTCVRVPKTWAPIRSAASGEDGFTLIEVMIAIVLMTIGLLAAAGSFPSLMAQALYGND